MHLLLLLACAGPAPVDRARTFFASRPIYEQPLDDGVAPIGLQSLSAASCGTCHPDQYAEWQVSTHAHAWTDPQLQAEMTKSENRWMCQNCHTPLLVQQQRWPTDLVDGDVERPVWVENPSFDEELQQEGITCAACHLRGGVIVGPTGAPTDAHPTAADPSYTNETFCLRCHQATATYPGKTFTCTFHTGEEWAAGPYGKAGQPCQTCHMKEATDEAGKTHRRHWWAGGGLGKVAGVYPPPEALPPGLVVAAVRDGADLRVDLVNANAGHMVPTGDPERFYWIELTFRDATGATLGAPWTTRVGQTWEWWPTPRQLGDNRVPPGGQRSERAPIPAGAVEAALVVTRNRMTPETRDYHHLSDYPIGVEVKREIIPLNP